MVSGALLLWETRLVRSVWENLGATHCLASQGIAEESRTTEQHGGREEQGRMGRAWQTAWESRAKKITGSISEQSEAGSLGGDLVTW